MLGPTHLLVGAACQKWAGSKSGPWFYIPAALASHGILDASVIYHDFAGWRVVFLVLPTAFVAWFCVRKRLWVGALLAVIPDIEHVIPGLFHLPQRLHHYIQLYPPWNWHDLYGQWWGILAEAAIVVILAWNIRVEAAPPPASPLPRGERAG